MKYRTQSANALNDADAFGKKLDWILFVAENESAFYGGAEGEWSPGDALFNRPTAYTRMGVGSGNYIRPMFEEIEPNCQECLELIHS